MDARSKKLTALLIAITILFCSAFEGIKPVLSSDDLGQVDLFTQKEPYGGKGSYMPSDAFGPEEIVILYALATYNGAPVEGLLVAFDVRTPTNRSFSFSAITNSSGMAMVNFTLMTPPQDSESEVFGVWLASANVLIDGENFQDTLTFKVDYVVKLISARTIDENLTDRTFFGREGDVGLEITLRSIAMALRNATVAIVALDETGALVDFSMISDFGVQPNEKLVYMYCKLHISKYARIGEATIFISALTKQVEENGVPYCPGITTNFYISPFDPLVLAFHDVGVINVVPSAAFVEKGQPLSVRIMVQNEATEVESFNITAYLNDTVIGTLDVITLLPYSRATLNFEIDTSVFDVGNYTIRASIPPLINEADLTDNEYADGIVEIYIRPLVIVHDVAITSVTLSNSTAYIGESVKINVTVFNKGNGTETFNVETYYDSSIVEAVMVNDLAPGAQLTFMVVWDTTFVDEGFYQISASALLPDDVVPSDNTYVDGVVEVKSKVTPPIMMHDVAVLNVVPSPTSVYVGDTVEISVVVKNLGNYTESFTLMVYYNSSLIEIKLVQNLDAKKEREVVFLWDTDDVVVGNYTIVARASAVSGEENLDNNHFVDGVVQIESAAPSLVHDIAVLEVVPSSSIIYVGDTVDINVTVRNKGTETETFNVTVYYDSNMIATLTVNELTAGAEYVLVFHWNTRNVRLGAYTLSASAPLLDDANVSDNSLTDGIIRIAAPPAERFVPDWVYWFLLPLLLLLVLLLILLLYRRRRKKRGEETFSSGWTAWYYFYDLRKASGGKSKGFKASYPKSKK